MDNKFKDKKVLILGLGTNQGGVGSAKFFARQGAKVRVTDLKSEKELAPSLAQLSEFENIEYILGEHRFEDLDWADLIIRNQAIKPDNKYLLYALEHKKKVEMDMGIFLQFVKKDQLIGVTGTKGKSTTSSLIYESLKADGRDVLHAGNIGIGVLDAIQYVTEKTLVVLELSSFQLEAFEQHNISPKIAVITNIFPDHLNYYASMEDYIAAKRVIAKFQSKDDFLFVRKDDQVVNKKFLENLEGHISYFSTLDLSKDFMPLLKGIHNLENIAAALAVVRNLGVSEETALEAMKNFEGVEFRLQLIFKDKENNIRIYNDTAATNPGAAVQAVSSFPSCILIAGGMNKNLDFREYSKAIDLHAKKVYFLEGEATEEIKEYMKDRRKMMSTYNDLVTMLKDIKSNLEKGDVIVFSPGATSFNLFQNEFDRGRKFNEAVKKVFGEILNDDRNR